MAITLVSKPCKWCGKEFEGNINSRYCSDECRKMAIAEYQKDFRSKNNSGMEPRSCKWCGKVFQPKSSMAAYCCPECRRESIKKQNHERIPKPREKKTEVITCKCCGAKMTRTNKRQIYCSIKCRNNGNNLERKKENEKVFVSTLKETEEEARRLGMSYGQYKSIEVIEAYARVDLPEWARR